MNRFLEKLIYILINLGYIYPLLIVLFIFLFSINYARFERSSKRFIDVVIYKKRAWPLIRFSSYMVIALLYLIIFSLFYLDLPLKEYEEYEVDKQIVELDEMQDSLKNLQNLISAQKEKLITTEKYVKLLKMEKEKLETVLKADKELVKKILTLQQEKRISQAWKDRFIGFVMSMLAGIVIIMSSNYWKSWKQRKLNKLK